MTGTDAMSAATFNGQILRRIKELAITRLVHFTRVTSLAGIIAAREIASTRSLLNRGVNGVVNDPRRLDRHRDYVCCSIEYPNVYLLDDYRKERPEQEWVHLCLTPVLLALPSTRFSPVNAATARGDLVQDGIEGFESMFQPRVSARGRRRQEYRLPNCPTDIQAEVLVRHAVPTWAIVQIVVESDAVKASVAPLLAIWPTDKPLPSWPVEPPTVDVQKDLFDRNELSKTIRGYKR